MGAYSVLEHIVAHLRPSDLYALAGTCNTAYGHLKLDQPTSKANLLTKTLCTGNGMVTQSKTKTSPQALGYETFRNLSKCGGLDNGALIQSRPCSNYGINTCDEWRFHLVYHSLLENPGLDEARWWSGYIAGESTPRRLFPPKEALASSPWHASYRSQHDQGMVGVPFVDSSFAKPEPMDRMLDTDIGRQVLLQATGTLLGPPGRDNETIKLFRPMSLRRIRHRCKDCFAKAKVTKKCGCTLRKHYLDRWTCLDCSSAEEAQETQDLRLVGVTTFRCLCIEKRQSLHSTWFAAGVRARSSTSRSRKK